MTDPNGEYATTDQEHASLREEWRIRTPYGKLFVPLMAVARAIDVLLLAVMGVLIGMVWVIFKGPDVLLAKIGAWASERTPAVYDEEVSDS